MVTDRGQNGALVLGGRLFGSPLLNGALNAGVTTMAIDGVTLVGVVAVGDTFTIAGESGTPTHTVTGGPFYVTAGNAIAGITFSTVIAAGGAADDAAVTFASNSMGEVRSWTIDSAGLEMMDDTVKGDTHRTFKGGLAVFSGSASALLDYDDAQQKELIDLIATGSPDGAIASLIFEVAPTRFFYGGAVLQNFVTGSEEGSPVLIGFAFRGTGQILLSIGGAFDDFNDANGNLSGHTPNFGFGGWTYSGAANEWVISGNQALKSNTAGTLAFCRSDLDVAGDSFSAYADYTRNAVDDTGGRCGIYILASDVTAIANGHGVLVEFRRSGGGTMDLYIVRRDASGVEQQSSNLATITIPTGTSLRLGVTVDGLNVNAWTEPSGGGTRTDRGTLVLGVDLRDGTHNRIGLTGRASTFTGSFMNDLTVVLT